ncbi:MAG TPA: hypothetical protein VFI27_09160, partial [candidate division Zixibacteria bacterium]|nr:hypothetical protein [candidate division Zixibacteria bacterium]
MDLASARRWTRKLRAVPRNFSDYFGFSGGLNQLDTPLNVKPGQCNNALNYEMGIAGGYKRIGGYQVFDGRPAPAGDYELLAYGAATDPALALGSTINGGSSGASGVLLAVTDDGGFGINQVLHNEDLTDAYWAKINTNVTDDDEVWSDGKTPFLSKLENSGAGAPRIAHSSGFGVALGEKVYISGYARYSAAGAVEVMAASLSNFTGSFGAGSATASFNLKNGTASSSQAEDYGVELVSDGVYRWWVLSPACTSLDTDFGVNISYGGFATPTGDYIHVSGIMIVIGANPVPSGGFGYVKTTSATKNVNSGNLVLGPVSSGPFTDDEDLDVLASVFGQAIGTNWPNSETDPALDADYSELARSIIAVAPAGSGAIRGVWEYEGVAYCFRDNAGATACVMFKETSGGWVAVTFNDVVNFDAGNGTEPNEGDTVTVTAGTKSATILRKVLTSGTWGLDAVGYFVLDTITNGPIADNDVLLVSAVRIADAAGASAVPTLLPGGRYEFRNNNFYGSTDTYRMYGVDGKNKGFE